MRAVDWRRGQSWAKNNLQLWDSIRYIFFLDESGMQLDNMFSFRTNVLLDNSTTNFLLSFGPRLQTIELNQIRDVQISDILSNCHLLQSFTLDKCTFKTSQFDEHPQQHFGQHLEKIKIVGGSRLKFYEDRIADSNLEYGELVNLFQCPNVRDIHIGYCSAYFDHVLLSAFRKHRFSNLSSCFLSESNSLYYIAILQNRIYEYVRREWFSIATGRNWELEIVFDR